VPVAKDGGSKGAIRLLLADVDGTLVDPQKRLTEAAIAAAAELREAGIGLALVSGRPPRGMEMLVEPLGIDTPLAGFNGGLIVDPAGAVLCSHLLAQPLVEEVLAVLARAGADVWLYRPDGWYLKSPAAPHVEREEGTVQFPPVVVDRFEGLLGEVVKVVGVSDREEVLVEAQRELAAGLGAAVSASRSQPYYLDVTHPQANKGFVVEWLANYLGIEPQQVAAIGDMPNDVLAFQRAGLAIAMGNAPKSVQRAADVVTDPNTADGFAKAVRRFVLAAGALNP